MYVCFIHVHPPLKNPGYGLGNMKFHKCIHKVIRSAKITITKQDIKICLELRPGRTSHDITNILNQWMLILLSMNMLYSWFIKVELRNLDT